MVWVLAVVLLQWHHYSVGGSVHVGGVRLLARHTALIFLTNVAHFSPPLVDSTKTKDLILILTRIKLHVLDFQYSSLIWDGKEGGGRERGRGGNLEVE